MVQNLQKNLDNDYDGSFALGQLAGMLNKLSLAILTWSHWL